MIEKLKIKNKPDRNLLLSFIAIAQPENADDLLVEFASHKMHERLYAQRNRGYKGWNTPQCENSDLKERLVKNTESEDWIDVINLAAMLLARTQMFEEIPMAYTESALQEKNETKPRTDSDRLNWLINNSSTVCHNRDEGTSWINVYYPEGRLKRSEMLNDPISAIDAAMDGKLIEP